MTSSRRIPRRRLETRPRPALLALGYSEPRVVRLERRETILGTGPQCDVRVPLRGVASEHGKIVMNTPGQVTLIDLGTRNGTFVNGERVSGCAVLREGDEIHLGPMAPFRFTANSDRSTGAPALDRLTAREREIAELVAQGLTNGKIAALLGLKPRTVASHLEHIYDKLAIGSRVQLARIVMESARAWPSV